MPKATYIHVESYGAVWRFGPRQWKRLLAQLAAGWVHTDYKDYGKLLGIIDHSITGITAEQAAELLNKEDQ